MSGWRHRSRRVRLLPLALFLSCCALTASAQDPPRPKAAALPSFAELRTGWNVLRPSGETKCAKGGEYAFSVRPGEKDKLLVWFEGGGACWTAEECDRGFYTPQIDVNATNSRNLGIFDQSNPANPFSGYSTVVVPYCTGDIHLGDRDTTYTLRNDRGERRQFTIHHRGQVNAMAVLRWVQETFPAPREIFVSGTSAGSYPSPFYASALARHYPQARVVALADAIGHRGLSVPAPDNNVWGFPGVLRRHPGWERFPENWQPSDFFIAAARRAPRLQLFQFNHAHDGEARFRLRQLGRLDGGKADMVSLLRDEQREITRQVSSFRYFTVGGLSHGVLPQSGFYTYSTGGQLFRDWVARIAAGEPVSSVDCTDCSRAEFVFSEEDLRIVERALALVSAPNAWNSDDPPQRCGPKIDRYSLECALQMATFQITGRPNSNRAGPWEVIYTAVGRLGPDVARMDDEQVEPGLMPPLVLRRFNNRPGTTVADVIGVLEEARDRIRADLRRKLK